MSYRPRTGLIAMSQDTKNADNLQKTIPSDSITRWTPLVSAASFPLLGRIRGFHPLKASAARRTTIIVF